MDPQLSPQLIGSEQVSVWAGGRWCVCVGGGQMVCVCVCVCVGGTDGDPSLLLCTHIVAVGSPDVCLCLLSTVLLLFHCVSGLWDQVIAVAITQEIAHIHCHRAQG